MEIPASRSGGHDRTPAPSDADLVDRLRTGDESAFVWMVDTWSPLMLRVARGYVTTAASAEEVVQETWVALLRGLDGFEGRSSLRTWTFRILSNIAKTRATRERRTVPLSSLAPEEGRPAEDADRFQGPEGRRPGWWTPEGRPEQWQPPADSAVLAGEIRALVEAALQDLPDRQRVVVTLRDVEGLDPDETCRILGLSAENQRVLLHRGRVKLRAALEAYYRQGAMSA
jgi:RNA polymerase sigma-70 factor (ECF subfamily)